MKENQRLEWKATWRDEFLRWICGFANADGGVLHIGRNDNGTVVGLPDAEKLLEDIQRIFDACKSAGSPRPHLRHDANDLWLEFPFAPEYLKAMPATGEQVTAEVAGPVTAPVGEFVAKLLHLLGQQEPLGNENVRLAFSLKSRRLLRETYLVPALAAALIERTLPDKPNSRFQKYRLTAQGRAWLAQHPSSP